MDYSEIQTAGVPIASRQTDTLLSMLNSGQVTLVMGLFKLCGLFSSRKSRLKRVRLQTWAQFSPMRKCQQVPNWHEITHLSARIVVLLLADWGWDPKKKKFSPCQVFNHITDTSITKAGQKIWIWCNMFLHTVMCRDSDWQRAGLYFPSRQVGIKTIWYAHQRF